MKKPLIHEALKPLNWQLESFSANVVSVNDIITRYPQLSNDELHDIDVLEFLTQSNDSVLYKFDGTILKYVTHDSDAVVEGFYREIIIGLHLNTLNLPNFVRTIGYHTSNKCSIPKVGTDKTCTYLYVKEIHGPTLAKFIPKSSLVQFKDVMIKLLDAYKIAHEELDFCHYDLHCKNVIISTKDNDLIPVFIDFGASHIKLKDGSNIGLRWSEEGIYDGVALWVHDLFKIFGFAWKLSLYEVQFRQMDAKFDLALSNFETVLYDMSKYTEPLTRYKEFWNEELNGYEDLDETAEEFIDRLESSRVQIVGDMSVEYLRAMMRNMNNKHDAKLKSLRENKDNLDDINKYCRKVLKYFKSEIWGSSYLEHYSKSISPIFGISVTKAGKEAVLQDFIDYVKTL